MSARTRRPYCSPSRPLPPPHTHTHAPHLVCELPPGVRPVIHKARHAAVVHVGRLPQKRPRRPLPIIIFAATARAVAVLLLLLLLVLLVRFLLLVLLHFPLLVLLLQHLAVQVLLHVADEVRRHGLGLEDLRVSQRAARAREPVSSHVRAAAKWMMRRQGRFQFAERQYGQAAHKTHT